MEKEKVKQILSVLKTMLDEQKAFRQEVKENFTEVNNKLDRIESFEKSLIEKSKNLKNFM
ncbi:hypothetical protein DFO73_11636 [Cytobacillus oceanisediminis]|uniref:Uncharacterized protein n=1 Tax=Cytobacillus oceanisediminis TaxID=665099 RepID=A0A2V2ZKP2_9BACI|nr:hypothetical protein [Cytobacillus oceanisediminis]PWW20222.1 hypothetical protein DFO73_11636 [Cytobacillus oceanisediminis]